jgi:hypothetical protein
MAVTRLWRALVLACLGFGMAWAATQVGDGPPSSGPVADSAEATAAAAEAPPPAVAPDAGPPGATPDPGIQDLTTAEVDAELKNLEQALSGRPDPGERVADKPLPADLGVPLPSDI